MSTKASNPKLIITAVAFLVVLGILYGVYLKQMMLVIIK